jgi:hypothetical protein
MDQKSFTTQNWAVALAIALAVAALIVALVSGMAWWFKAGLLALAAWACWEVRPRAVTPKYPEEDWDIERDWRPTQPLSPPLETNHPPAQR